MATVYGEDVDIGRVMQRGFSVVGGNAAGFVLAAAIFVGLPSFLVEYLATPDPESMLDHGGWPAALMLAWVLLYVFGDSLLQVAVVRSSVLGRNGRRPEFGRNLATTIGFVLPVLGLSLVYGLCAALGLLLLVVPGIIVMCMWFVAVPVLVEERAGIMKSLARSSELTSGSRWHVFGLMVILSLLSWALGTLGAILPAIAAPGNDLVVALCNAVAAALSGVFGAAVAASLYVELRQVREGATSDNLVAIFD